ncbi:hypothetical protein B566_EDAN015576 [Ephemera danica]|nr:hypothetical protein B566_EDAN015576 [Ephemera danica]
MSNLGGLMGLFTLNSITIYQHEDSLHITRIRSCYTDIKPLRLPTYSMDAEDKVGQQTSEFWDYLDVIDAVGICPAWNVMERPAGALCLLSMIEFNKVSGACNITKFDVWVPPMEFEKIIVDYKYIVNLWFMENIGSSATLPPAGSSCYLCAL